MLLNIFALCILKKINKGILFLDILKQNIKKEVVSKKIINKAAGAV